MCEDFALNVGDKRTGCCILTTHRLTLPFPPGDFFTKDNINLVAPHKAYFSLFPWLNIKLIGRHFDTVEVMEAESQAVLNTLTEHDLQDAFKNGRSAGNGAYTRKENTWWVVVASRP
jgi:hypothetical protein